MVELPVKVAVGIGFTVITDGIFKVATPEVFKTFELRSENYCLPLKLPL
jgi:hypothetical protein